MRRTLGRMARIALPLGLLAPYPAPAAPASAAASVRPYPASVYAAAFRDMCLRAEFDPARIRSAFERIGWKGTILQRPSSAAQFTAWAFPFGELHVGYRTVGGVDLRIFSCSLVIKASLAPPRSDLSAAIEEVLAPSRLRENQSATAGFIYVARLKDSSDEQARVQFSGDRVPFSRPGAIFLGPGVLLDYTYAKGPHARALTGR
jgi:hypothetical protein